MQYRYERDLILPEDLPAIMELLLKELGYTFKSVTTEYIDGAKTVVTLTKARDSDDIKPPVPVIF